ncbi:hypothetical protein SAMN03003324_02723 [Pedobacter antarcticus]|uniref:Uncharacterized protein n=1 Tax=Pedobacter antarcticus TaxID=34086 RepID=A0A1I2GK64_9SPHI|nr:hypothetical protein SAMN03003324_02723 [Pedobacter antarcticus]
MNNMIRVRAQKKEQKLRFYAPLNSRLLNQSEKREGSIFTQEIKSSIVAVIGNN